jgi:hypothetical protein
MISSADGGSGLAHTSTVLPVALFSSSASGTQEFVDDEPDSIVDTPLVYVEQQVQSLRCRPELIVTDASRHTVQVGAIVGAQPFESCCAHR